MVTELVCAWCHDNEVAAPEPTIKTRRSRNGTERRTSRNYDLDEPGLGASAPAPGTSTEQAVAALEKEVRYSCLVAPKPTRATSGTRTREHLTAVLAGLLAIGALVVGSDFQKFHAASPHAGLVEWLSAFVLLIAGILTVRSIAATLGRIITRQSVKSAGAAVRLVATGVGYVVLLFAIFAVLGVSAQRLLIGAGVAGVVLGIAAQQSLANIFASLVLLFARPFGVGDYIRIRSGNLGVLDVWVEGIGLTYVTVRTEDGILKIPNSAMLASGIGQLATASEKTRKTNG